VRTGDQPLRIGYLSGRPAESGLTDLRAGVLQAAAEIRRAAQVLGRQVELVQATSETEDVGVAIERMIDKGVVAIVGDGEGATMGEMMEETDHQNVLLLNAACSDDALRMTCSRNAFHVQASASVYLDAVLEWLNAHGGLRWFFIVPDSEVGTALGERARASLGNADAPVIPIGIGSVGTGDAVEEIAHARPDVVCVALPDSDRAFFLRSLLPRADHTLVTAIPLSDAPPVPVPDSLPGNVWWPVIWHPGRARFGATQLNERFQRRWHRPLTAGGWAGWMAVKIIWETVLKAGASRPDRLVRALRNQQTMFDGHKGVPLTFRVSDHQLRQPIYIIRVGQDAPAEAGEVPRTSERLERLGDPAGATACDEGTEVWT
jgi:ABC-type branched-subunit amino acid transport system substrate-binding protein